MKKLFYFSVIILLYVSCNDNNNKIEKTTFEDTQATVGKNFTGNNATVYLTAQNTDKRLALDSENQFTNANQPLETEIAVFVNPEKKFQGASAILSAFKPSYTLLRNVSPSPVEIAFGP